MLSKILQVLTELFIQGVNYMLDKNEKKVSKLNYYCDKCFCLLAGMKIVNNEEDFKGLKVIFDSYYEQFIIEKQMLIDIDKLLGD